MKGWVCGLTSLG